MRSPDEIMNRIAALEVELLPEVNGGDGYLDEGQQAELEAYIWVLDHHYDEDLVKDKARTMAMEQGLID